MQYTSYTHYLHTLPTYINFLAMKCTHDMHINFFAMHPPYIHAPIPHSTCNAMPSHLRTSPFSPCNAIAPTHITFFAMQCSPTYIRTYIHSLSSTFSPCSRVAVAYYLLPETWAATRVADAHVCEYDDDDDGDDGDEDYGDIDDNKNADGTYNNDYSDDDEDDDDNNNRN